MTNTATVSTGKVVTLHYTLTVGGKVLESSRDSEPFDYLHGAGNIVPGLEEAVEGKAIGDSIDVTVPPAKGYGERDAEGVQTVARSSFPDDVELEAGMQFMTETDDGVQVPGMIAVIEGDEVTVDFNHPLAGETLEFAVEVMAVRDAKPEEQEHGHPHGEDGCD